MAVESMTIIDPGDRVPRPIGALGIEKDYARAFKALISLAPYVVVPHRRSRLRPPCPGKPGMLVGGMVDHQLGDDAQVALMAGIDEPSEVPHRPVRWMNVTIVRDVVT